MNDTNLQKQIDIVMNRLKQENELLKKKHTSKNSRCEFFEGQTGLCRAKGFTRCNPINCKIYTLDSVSTILELQKENDKLKEENKWYKTTIEELTS